jgi:hypothetical protein
MENTEAKNRSEVGNTLFSWLRREPVRHFPGSPSEKPQNSESLRQRLSETESPFRDVDRSDG